MGVDFPGNCNTEASRLSFTTKLIGGVLIPWHNAQVAGMTAAEAKAWRDTYYKPKFKVVDAEKNVNRAIAEAGIFWNPKKPINWINNAVVYPPGLDQANEGSRQSFLIGLRAILYRSGMEHHEMKDLNDRLAQAKQDAISGTEWSPTLGDIS